MLKSSLCCCSASPSSHPRGLSVKLLSNTVLEYMYCVSLTQRPLYYTRPAGDWHTAAELAPINVFVLQRVINHSQRLITRICPTLFFSTVKLNKSGSTRPGIRCATSSCPYFIKIEPTVSVNRDRFHIPAHLLDWSLWNSSACCQVNAAPRCPDLHVKGLIDSDGSIQWWD